jgi:hypothetical protein
MSSTSCVEQRKEKARKLMRNKCKRLLNDSRKEIKCFEYLL